MIPILSLLITLTLALLVTRVATVALRLTGLSKESARFQARSAFSGVGFTTAEAENVVGHPVRRRIVMLLMLFGNAGLVTVMSSLVLSFIDMREEENVWFTYALLTAGLALLWIAAASKWLEHRLQRLIEWALRKWTDLDVRDYTTLLSLYSGYRVAEATVEPQDYLAGRSLDELGLAQRGMAILGIRRGDNSYEGAPHGWTRIEAGDTLIIYGKDGDVAHVCGTAIRRK